MNERNKIRRNLLIALFAALMAAGAYLRIPIGPVPITLTSFFMLTSALILGPAWGTVSVLIYLLTGTIGLPIFSGGGGPAVFLGPTGGFLLAYLPAAAVCGLVSSGSERFTAEGFPLRDSLAVAAGSLILYAVGVPWLKWRLGIEWQSAFAAGMLPFLPGDAVKSAAAVIIRKALVKTAPELLPVRS